MIIFIPAKGKSKRIPMKNLQLLHDRSLIAWTVDKYRRWFPDAKIVVATESPAIQMTVRPFGCQLYGLTPADINDKRFGTELLQEYLMTVPPTERVILAQVTSPFTFRDEVISALRSRDDYLVSGYTKTFFRNDDFRLSQDIPPETYVTGNFNVTFGQQIIIGKSPTISQVNWLSAIDIDTMEDLNLARLIAKRFKIEDFD